MLDTEENVEEFHVPRLNESDGDSDRELEAAKAVGILKPGMFRPITAPKPAINNKEGLLQKLEEIKLDLDWVERLDVTVPVKRSEKLTTKDGEIEEKEFDVHNDFQREMSFYEQAKDSVLLALDRLHKAGIKTLRPDDYFAEMAKKDDHMKRVREKLLALKRRRQTIERNKMDAKMKKYGKQVQHAVLRERQQKKREMLNAVKKYQKEKGGNLDFLEDKKEEPHKKNKKLSQFQKFDEQQKKRKLGQGGSKLKRKGSVSGKRAYKNAKYGFGGRKKTSKWNTKESFDNIRKKSNKSFGGGKSGKGKNYRVGKNRRAQMKSKGKS